MDDNDLRSVLNPVSSGKFGPDKDEVVGSNPIGPTRNPLLINDLQGVLFCPLPLLLRTPIGAQAAE